MNNLASLLQRRGKPEEAALMFKELLDGCTAALPPGHCYTAIFQSNYGDCLIDLGRFDEAQTVLVAAQSALEKALGPKHDRVTKNIGRMERLERTRAEHP